MKIRLLQSIMGVINGKRGAHQTGAILDVDAKTAKELIDAKIAEKINDKKAHAKRK